MFGVKKEEYEQVVKANNELRMKMEKLRLENALLKDQVRAVLTLPPNQSSLYVFIQLRMSTSIVDILSEEKFASIGEKEILKDLEELAKRGLLDLLKKDGVLYYSIKTPDITTAWAPKREE